MFLIAFIVKKLLFVLILFLCYLTIVLIIDVFLDGRSVAVKHTGKV